MNVSVWSRQASAPRLARRGERGAVLVELALVALAISMLFAATVEFGRLMFSAQAVQDVARVAARELSLVSLPADMDFDTALVDAGVQAGIYDPALLVLDLGTFPTDADVDAFFAGAPVVNRALRPLMIVDTLGDGTRLLRYPGALLTDATTPTGYTVGIPRVASRDASGIETIEWVPVLEEIRSDPAVPGTGPFSLSPTSPLPENERGLVAIRINYPYQAGALVGYAANPAGAFEPNADTPLTADDGAVAETAPGSAPGGLLPDDPTAVGAYAGPYGLGRQLAYGGRTVRPFRRLLSGQAIYRREVFQ